MPADEKALQRSIDALLRPRMGHVPTPWPVSLRRAVRRLASERELDEETFLRNLASRPERALVDQLVTAASVPHTGFFRHAAHFARLRERLIALKRPARIWCAGCATGEEPYSVALTAQEVGAAVTILATDVNDDALAVARRGRYAKHVAARARLTEDAEWQAPPELRQCIRFVKASIADPDPCPGEDSFDFVFCRNVLLYFETHVAQQLIAALAQRVRRGGALVLSPVEALRALPEGLQRVEPLGFVEKVTKMPSIRAPSIRPPSAPARPTSGDLEHAARALGLGALDEAETTLRALLDREPGSSETWFLLAEVLLQRGERAQARVAFERAARTADESPEGRTLANAAFRRSAKLR